MPNEHAARTRVCLARCASYDPVLVRQSLSALLEPLGGMSAFVKPGQRVLLKPNLIVPRRADQAITTHPEVVRAAALAVREAGATPVIGDSPAFGSAYWVAQACGMAAMAKEIGVEIVDLGHRPRTVRLGSESPFPKMGMGEEVLRADAIINLPKIKTHCQMGMTIAVKNMYGAVAGKRKTWRHFFTDDRVAFGRMLVAICRLLKPVLTIADGIVALERNGPSEGDPRALGILAASADPVALERIIVEILGVDLSTLPVFEAARQMGYGEQNLDQIEVIGEPIESLRVRDYVTIAQMSPISFTLPRVLRSLAKQAKMLLAARLNASRK